MGTSTAPPPWDELRPRLAELLPRDQSRLRRRIDGARKIRKPEALAAVVAQINAEIETAERRLASRRESVPPLRYPEELPVSQRRDDIRAAVRDHQVVIVAGETGSGKTTQIPKICLELGRGVRGMIGHTQPRRIAARTVAERIAEELDVTLGAAVGYQVRFGGQVGDETLVKLMTDGILLAEIQNDRMLSRYDTLIIDEAHERSLNIDFILGYLKQLLPRRPDLKVVITSATIDPERFSRHFDDAPIVEVSGRTYPVEVRYRPLEAVPTADDGEDDEAEPLDQISAVCRAVDELSAEGPGDILVFLSGEREIRDTFDALRKHTQDRRNAPEILPLYARLSTSEQHRIFQPHPGRRVVLATNVAETSLTVPGIKYVIDPGTARISRYSHRLKVQRLPIEPVSQASANQRKGRCGRTSDGICVRLYSEVDFEARPEFTEPEILRTNLASVILQMTALGLGDVAAFPFVEPPDRRNIADGVQLLEELGALEPGQPAAERRLTPIGRKLAQLPVDPRLARMVVEAEANGCVPEVLVIAAALSIQDPRERPSDGPQAADEKHARFAEPDSDFLAYLNLWRYLRDRQKELSSSGFRRLCRSEFLHYLRVREWQDLNSQLREAVRGLGMTVGSNLSDPPVDARRIHTSLLAGLLSHVGLKDVETQARHPAAAGREYVGARGAKFAIFPGSTLFRKNPRWVMAAELVETSRLWARIVAKIEPEWVEPLAGHLLKRSYSEPHWEARQGAVMAYERATLYGVPVVVQRKVNYGAIDPQLSRELFIRHALVDGDWRTHHEFFAANRSLLEEVEELEHRARRRDIMVDDETLFAFYDARLPADVVSARHFDSWWKKARRDDPDLLNFEKSMLVNAAADRVDARDYPDAWRQGGLSLPLTYQFEPGTEADGVTVHIPLAALNQVRPDGFDWQIPGLREELLTALIRSLPKAVRRNFVPVPDHARALLERVGPDQGPILDVLTRELHRLSGTPLPRDPFDLTKVPDHLRMTFRVVGPDGVPVGEGRDLVALQRQLAVKARREIESVGDELTRSRLTTWTVGTLPRVFERRRGEYAVKAYPALVDEGETVGVRLFETEAAQRQAMWAGTRRLLLLTVPSPIPLLSRRLSTEVKLGLTRYPYGTVPQLLDDCVAASVDRLMAEAGGPAWDEAGFARLRDAVRQDLTDATVEMVRAAEKVVAALHDVRSTLERLAAVPALAGALADIHAQLGGLVFPGFVTDAGWRHLPDVPRYLRGIRYRLEKLPQNLPRDAEWTRQVAEVQQEYREFLGELPPERRDEPAVRAIRWLVEELRISLFAQAVGTAQPVSEKRIYRAMDDVH